MFLDQVKKQLQKMSKAQKDEWILTQARMQEEYEQSSFMLSLTGEKKVMGMPSRKEIEAFCQAVDQGEIYLAYETHYYEFDDDGRYLDDWKDLYHDPFDAMDFLDKIFKGCHKLLILNEYKTVAEIFDQVCQLGFQIVESSESDDGFEGDLPFTLVDADEKNLMSTSIRSIGTDWITAYVNLQDNWNSQELATKLVALLTRPICKDVDPIILIGENIPQDLFSRIIKILNRQISADEAEFSKLFSKNIFSLDKYSYENKIKRKRELVDNIQTKCLSVTSDQSNQKVSILISSWKQIKELIQELEFEPYIDDQWEIEKIWNICSALIKHGNLGQESWKLRENILADMIENNFYDHYGCYDPIHELSEELCVTDNEFLTLADIMTDSGYFGKEAAHLYRKYGRDDKYLAYFESHLGKESDPYIELIDYYIAHERLDEACRVAEMALEKCKGDQTDAFICLLIDAKAKNDSVRYEKLYKSAKRRYRRVDIHQVDQALSD